MGTTILRGAAILFATALATAGGVATAQEGTTSSGSSAESHAAQVEGGGHSAGAGSSSADSSGQATGSGAHLDDQNMGGEAGPGQQNEGALADSDTVNEEGQGGKVAVLAWSADGTPGNAQGFGAALLVEVKDPEGDEAAYLELLSSRSTATTTQSTGESQLALLRLGGDQLVVTLLHASASSDGTGTTWLVGLNENHVFTDQEANDTCALEVPDVVALSCLSVKAASAEVVAQVLAGSAGSADQGGTVGLFNASATGQASVLDDSFTPDGGFTGGDTGGGLPGELALTGEDALMRGLAAAALLFGGLAGLVSSRNRSRTSAIPRPRPLR